MVFPLLIVVGGWPPLIIYGGGQQRRAGPPMNEDDALHCWRQLYKGERARLPNGFWAGTDGQKRAVSLLRYGLKKHLSDILRHLKLDGASQTCFRNPADYFLIAFPRLRREDVRDAREQYAKSHRYFESIDTEEKAYLLGLLATDGNVSGNTISLALKARDRILLERFERAIGLRPSSIRPMLKGMLRTAVTSAEMARDLASHGVVPNKTKTLDWPRGLPRRLWRHYLRGVFDGDGGISGRQWSIVSASERFILRTKSCLDKVARRALPVNRAGPSRASWVLTGGLNDWMVLDWLYHRATIFLPRKHRLYRDLLPRILLFPAVVLSRRTGRRRIGQDSRGRFARGAASNGHVVINGQVLTLRCSYCRRAFDREASAVSLMSYQFCAACRGANMQRAIHTQGYFERLRNIGSLRRHHG